MYCLLNGLGWKKINVIVIEKFFLGGNLFDLLLDNKSLKKI